MVLTTPGTYPIEKRLADLGLRDRVVVPGYVPSDVLETLYAGALVFVYPSLYEGFGFPPLEAMARGVPAIVSNASSLPEVVGDAAVLVDPKKPSALADAIVTLSQDVARRRELVERGRRRAAFYRWERTAERHLDVFRSVVGIHEHSSSGV